MIRTTLLAATLAGVLTVSATTLAADFDSAAWRAEAGKHTRNNPRAGMLSAVERAVRPGMTREAVLSILGNPDSSEAGRDTWNLGGALFGADYEYYVITYGPDGTLQTQGMTRG